MAVKFQVHMDGSQHMLEAPNVCPQCHHAIYLGGPTAANALEKGNKVYGIQVVFLCPHDDCASYFIAYYEKDAKGKEIPAPHTLKPHQVITRSFSAEICSLSPDFQVIYSQAEHAQTVGLDQVAGPGFRKAFEFLIKDYANSVEPDPAKAAKIGKMTAVEVVRNYIKHPIAQQLAERTLWVGNDETHYIRKWDTLDITHLIELINLTAAYIELEEQSKKVIASMPVGGPPASGSTPTP